MMGDKPTWEPQERLTVDIENAGIDEVSKKLFRELVEEEETRSRTMSLEERIAEQEKERRMWGRLAEPPQSYRAEDHEWWQGTEKTAPAPALDAAAANKFAARWLAAAPNKGTTFSPIGVLPLLALLATAADGPARDELAGAIGVNAEEGQALALGLLKFFESTGGMAAAIGLWVRPEVKLRPEFKKTLPPSVVATFCSNESMSVVAPFWSNELWNQRLLDDWAKKKTHGIIPKYPASLDREMLMMLASAVTVETLWWDEFSYESAWGSHDTNVPLKRTSRNTEIIRASKDVTTVCVQGDSDVDVVLVIGHEGLPATEVLPLGLAAIEGAVQPIKNNTDDAMAAASIGAPGLVARLIDEDTGNNRPKVVLRVPPFRVTATHDLMDHKELFGLNSASTLIDDTGNFPAISSSVPLFVGGGGQEAVAHFTDIGFSAAALTYMAKFGAARPSPQKLAQLSIEFNRPFGFLAVHRKSNMVIFTGWVTEEYFNCTFEKGQE